MFDLLKIILLIIVLFFAYTFLQRYIPSNTPLINTITDDAPLEISEEDLWGIGSPLRGKVSLVSLGSTPHKEEAQEEYLEIRADISNSEIIDLSGWSVESLLSGVRVYIPPATLILKMTGSNEIQPAALAPGEYAYLHSGHSPIADITPSFHTNSCIGYVGNLIEFTPALKSDCNDPALILPPTPENIVTYGATCVEFLNQADSCTTYATEMPAHLLPACRDLIVSKLNYHSCLSTRLDTEGYDVFNNGGWYLYLNYDAEVWRNNYEIIRLLDENGLVVDVLRY